MSHATDSVTGFQLTVSVSVIGLRLQLEYLLCITLNIMFIPL